MNLVELKKEWQQEEHKVFSGWDFSYLENRTEEDELPWSYEQLIRDHLSENQQLLDMGTGGGEFLLKLGHPYDCTSVTEAYSPNYELCKKRLGSLGVNVKYVEDDSHLPFENDTFDIIINRHEAFDLDEVKRILKSGGIFITQQVGEYNNIDLTRYVHNNPELEYEFDNHFDKHLLKAKTIGLDVIQHNESFPMLRFYDVGALVYFAKIIEWEFSGFSVEEHFDQLLNLHEKIQSGEYIESKEHRYLIVAQKK